MTKILQRRKFVDKECKLCERFLLYQIQCHNMVLFFVFHDTNQYKWLRLSVLIEGAKIKRFRV